MIRTLYRCGYTLFFFSFFISCLDKKDSSGHTHAHSVSANYDSKYDELKFDYQFNLLNQYSLENSTLIKDFPIYDKNGHETTIAEEVKGGEGTVLLIRVYGDCFTCIAELVNEQIASISSFSKQLSKFKKVIFLANLNSPRELASVLNIDYSGDNFHSYYIPVGSNIVEQENGRRGIYYSSLNSKGDITLNYVYFPTLGETDFQQKYFEIILKKNAI